MWKEVLGPSVDLEAAVSGLFPGDAEYAKTVVNTIDMVLSSGDIHRWAELKRLDSHAAKHEKIAADYLLNIASLLMNRLCCLDGDTFCKQFRDIVYDRIENFHNQCRDGDSVPQSISRARAKHELLHAYNVKTYASIMSLVGAVLTRADEDTALELAKRIVSNHNHWFNLSHVLEFVKSLITASSSHFDLLVALAPSIGLVIAGVCGTRLGMSTQCRALIDQTPGVSVAISSVLMDMVDVARQQPASHGKAIVIASALNALACLNLGSDSRSIVNRIVSVMTDLVIDSHSAEELVNFLVCSARYVDDRSRVEYEFASSQLITDLIVRKLVPITIRLRALVLKYLRVMCYSNCPGSWLCSRALLTLDSPVFQFLVDSIAITDSDIVVHAAVELVRLLLQRDSVIKTKLGLSRELVSVVDLLVTPKLGLAPLSVISRHALNIRRCRKACCYILQQCIIRNSAATRQVLFLSESGDTKSVSENLARVLLDSEWEVDMDIVASALADLDSVDFESVNLRESKSLGNWSVSTLVSLNSVLESEWLFNLEAACEASDNPVIIANRLEYWLVSDNALCLSNEVKSVYHTFSARLLALLAIYESQGPLTADLLGLVETAVGIINNDLEKSLLAIDALFLLVDSAPPSAGSIADLEYLYALKIVAQTTDESLNQQAMLRFIQFRWPNRFAILRALLSCQEASAVSVDQLTFLLRVIGIELLMASLLVDSDAEHVRNMKDFGSSFLVADLAKGRCVITETLHNAFGVLVVKQLVPKTQDFILPDLQDPRLVDAALNEEIMNHTVLTGLVESLTAVIVHWSSITNEAEKSEVVSFLIESIDLNGNEFYRLNVFTKIVPRLYALLSGDGSMLAFNLRTLKMYLSQVAGCKNLVTRSGIVEALCYALTPFVASAEIWMIEKDRELARDVVDTILGFTFDVVEAKGKIQIQSVALPLTVLCSLLATRQSFTIIEVVKDMTIDRYRHQFEKSHDSFVAELVKQLIDIVEKEVLFQELAI